ncbi:hypothetical protein BUALT_Bualt06G0055600 [Buddleja alternifolia]|uniref:Transposase Tnp1/En/Spm-like domain-containing protein n=1 Tax=Buddleja alternifolia TaxID=168488 RepID=A0AAV6XEC0_9LAMI|nr:hypothetical protein BUALT_Bualt06G0055600 [Buddleja alternifolia]
MKRSDLVPSRAQMFRLIHTKNNQQFVDSKSAEILVQLSSRELDHLESLGVSASRGNSLSQSTIKSLQTFNLKYPTMPSALFKSASAMRVDLLSFEVLGEVVTQGRVVSKDSNKDVGGFKLGPHFWEVYAEIAIREEEFFIMPRGHFSTIKEVVGSTIVWPSSKANEKDQSPCLV